MAESNFNPFASSPAGAQGIAQFIPSTASAYGLNDPFDPVEAIDAQAHLMSDLIRQFGSPQLALAAYNAGPAPVEACHCVPAIPETTPTSAASSPYSAAPGRWVPSLRSEAGGVSWRADWQQPAIQYTRRCILV